MESDSLMNDVLEWDLVLSITAYILRVFQMYIYFGWLDAAL